LAYSLPKQREKLITNEEAMDKSAEVVTHNPAQKMFGKLYDFFASAKLALALLIVILLVCILSATFLSGEKAVKYVFSSFWFNSLLILLVINIACCFSGRILRRRLTIVSFGMILFHISFVTLLLGVVYNSLFYFRGTIRLTEGETLRSGDVNSYDKFEHGRFFSFLRVRGETGLITVHHNYKVGAENKRAAYEIAVGEGGAKKNGIIYVTHNLAHKGFTYYPDAEGYSLFVMLADASGKDIYGAHIPLQSLKQKNGSVVYATGSKEGASPFPFPQQHIQPFMGLLLGFVPSAALDRTGRVDYKAYPLVGDDFKIGDEPILEGHVKSGESFSAFNHGFAVREVRYWVTMTVRHEPGKPIVLASLCVCLLGMTITATVRMFRRREPSKDNSLLSNR
jgi:hypothetical protein